MDRKIFVILVLIIILFVGCEKDMKKEHKNEKVYYLGWGGYGAPLIPSSETSEEEALKLANYYIGYYDATGDLVKFEKWMDRKLFGKDEYEYYNNRKVKKVFVYTEGRLKSITYFKKNGKRIKTEVMDNTGDK